MNSQVPKLPQEHRQIETVAINMEFDPWGI
jgi:hypothetical protein